MRKFAIVLLWIAGCSDGPQLLESNSFQNNSSDSGTITGTNSETTLTGNQTSYEDDDDSLILDNDHPEPNQRDYMGTLPPRPTGEVEGFVFDMGKAFCERLVECRTDSRVARFANARQITTIGACVQDFLYRMSPASFQSSVDAGDRTFNASKGATCVTQLAGIACGDISAGYEGPGVILTSCGEAFDGDGRELADCVSNADCLPGLYCDRSIDSGCAGACMYGYVQTVICGDPVMNCTIDQFCDPVDLTCKPLPNTGEPCGPEGICAPNNFCFQDVCTANVVGYQAGQACDRVSALCALGLFCDADESDVGTCKELAPAGSACNTALWPGGCDASSYCKNGTCAPRIASGDCTSSDECLSGWCTSAGCVDGSVACVDTDDH